MFDQELSRRQLQSLIHVSNVLNSSLNQDEIIHSIMEETISVIEAADSGILFLYDKRKNTLEAKCSLGTNADIFRNVSIKPGESMTGQTFNARKTLMFNRKAIVHYIEHTMTDETLELIHKHHPLYPYSAICAPILNKDHCLGVITIDSFNEDKSFTTDDVRLLEAIAHQAASIIEKATLYREQQSSIHLLESMNSMIIQQNNLLKRSIDIHQSLANLVLNGESIEQILDYISNLFGNPVYLFDNIGGLLSKSNMQSLPVDLTTELEKQIRLKIMDFPQYNVAFNLEVQDQSIPIIVFPLGAKPNFLGYLVVLNSESLSEVDFTALEHVSSVLSLELIKSQTIFDSENSLKEKIIAELFAGNFNHRLIRTGNYIELEPNRTFQVITVQLDKLIQRSEQDDFSTFMVRKNVIQLARNIFLTNGNPLGLVAAKHDHVIILLSYSEHSSSSFIKNNSYGKSQLLLEQLLNRLQDRFNISIGIGRPATGLGHLQKSFEEAMKCIQYIRNFNLGRTVVTYSELGAKRLLLNHSTEELVDFAQDVLGGLLRYEKSDKRVFLNTLLAFIRNNNSLKETANSLHIHINTLNYRLKRVEEIIGVQLTDSSAMLDIYTAVQIYELLEQRLEKARI